MKARLVLHIRTTESRPGDIEFRKYPNEEPAGYAYRCPKCGHEDWLKIDDGMNGWVWNGNIDKPTLTPSILHTSCGWHGYLTDGVFIDC